MSSDSPDRLQKTLQERLVEGLFCHIPATVIGAIFVFGVNLAYYRNLLPTVSLLGAGALLAIFSISRLLLLAYYRRQPRGRSAVTWRNLHASTASVHSLAWCVLLVAAIRLDDQSLTAIATISVGGMIGASIATTSASIVSFSCFIVPLAIALPTAMYPYEDAFELTLAVGWVALLGFMMVSGRRLHSTLTHAEQTRIEKESLVDELKALSERDPLTNLYNRRHFTSRLDAAWTTAKKDGSCVGLLVADIDDFKRFNDTAGHVAGDECLREVARRFQQCCCEQREETVLARYGGEEFVVLLPRTDAAQASALAENLRQDLEASAIPHPNSRVGANVTVSVGVATIQPHAGLEPTSLFGAADLALYRAKSAGRNCAVGDEAGAQNTLRDLG